MMVGMEKGSMLQYINRSCCGRSYSVSQKQYDVFSDNNMASMRSCYVM